ncbi:MAG: hypothetical protein GY820_21250 [Gammaproteobacteria bacterium]|nr:hypothetical protein [Gammaproteobacteria bacterium]
MTFREPTIKSRQETLDDEDTVLEPEHQDQYNLRKVRRPRVYAALKAYELQMELDAAYSDPLY